MKINNLLVEFNFLINMDLAIFKYIKENYNNPDIVDQSIISMNNDFDIIELMLNRDHINPLEILMPGYETLNLYNDLINNHLEEILKYAKATDMFGYMVTLKKMAGSHTNITILCRNEIESNFIKSINNKFNIVINPKRENTPINRYDIIYLNYYSYILQYQNLSGKYIYITNAKYNMEPGRNIPLLHISSLISDVNIIKTIDIYCDIKYKRKKDNQNEQ